MQKRSKASLKLSLLSYAIAAAAAGMSQGALAVDLCAGNATTTISTNAAGDSCTLDTAAATLTITAAGSIDSQISVNITDASVSNAGTISTAGSNTSWTSVYGIKAGNLGAGASISNTGTITVSATSTSSSASANGIRFSQLTGGASVTNSGTVSVTADAEDWAGAYAVGNWNGGAFDDGHITNDTTGIITATSTGGGNYSYASAYGIFNNSGLSNGSSIGNAGTITATTTAAGGQDASAWGIYTSTLTDSSVTNSGTLTASATSGTTGTAWAGAWGVDAGSLNGSALVSNSGTLTATASGFTQATARGIETGAVLGTSSVTNSGSITATSTVASGYGIVFGIETNELDNSASISNTATGILSATITADTWASAYGISTSWMNNDASISNAGTITASATSVNSSASAFGISTGTLSTNSSITNSGDITATVSTLSGYGYVFGIHTSALYDDAAISNTATGTIAASITADTWGSAYGIYASAMNDNSVISNAGTITATATSVNSSASAWGIHTGYLYGGSVTNSGSITATASGTAAGQWAGAYALRTGDWTTMDGVTVTNTADGILSASATGDRGSAYGIELDGSLSNGSVISNAGTITATTTGGDASYASAYGIYASTMYDSSIANSGGITATVTAGDEWAGAWGIIAGSLNGTSSISNTDTGSIDVTINNNSYGSAYGIQTNGLFDSSVISNAGSITVGGTANTQVSVYGIGVDSVNNTASIANSGTITATATSLNSEASAWGIGTGYLNGGHVSNSGDIVVTATAAANGQWASAHGIGSWDWGTMSGATLENTADGTITATVNADNGSAYGLVAWNDVANGSSIRNAGAINVTANGGSVWAGAYGLYIGNVDGTSSVTNSGTITATTTVTSSAPGSAYGIYVNDLAAGGTVTNSGTITVSGSEGVDLVGIGVGSGAGDVINTVTGSIDGGVVLNGTVSLQNDGKLTLAAGQASHVGGDYTQGATGQITTMVKDAGTYGHISVGGTADFSASGKLVVELDPTLVLTTGTVLNDVVTAGTLTAPAGGYDIVDSSLFWDFTNVGNATSIDLAATQVDSASVFAGAGVAFTDSQRDAVNNLVNGSSGPQFSVLTDALNTAPTAAAAAAIAQQINPALTGSAGRAALAASSGIGALIDARQAETGAASGDAFTQNGVWLKTYLGKATQDAVNGVHGFDADTTGFVLGLDGNVSDDWRLGVAVASAKTDADDVNSALDIDTLQFTLYGNYAVSDSTALDVDVNHAVNGVDSTRRVGFAASTAIASYDGKQTALGLGLTHRAQVCSGFTVLPGVSVRYRQVHLDGYTETGAGVYDLTMQSRSDSSLLWQARLGMEVGLGGYGTLLGNLGAGYDTLDAASATATLNAGTGPTFISEGAKPESTVLNAGIGYRYVTAKGFEINALYELEDRDSFSADTASLKFRMPF